MSDFSANRHDGLDVIRAVAILFVLISHGRQTLPDPDAALYLTFGGWYGVELFFVLSGFLIGSILLRLSSKAFDAKALGRFWKRRWFRTVPAYFVALLFTWAVLGKVKLSYFLFLQGFEGSFYVLPVSWSLVVEEWFYLLFPICLLLLAPRCKAATFAVVAVAFLLLPIIARALQTDLDMNDIRKFPLRFDNLAIGALLALYVQRYSIPSTKVLLVLAVILTVSVLFIYEAPLLLGDEWNLPHAVRAIVFPVLTGFSAGAVILLAYTSLPQVHSSIGRPARYISVTSYSAYIWHLMVLNAILAVAGAWRGWSLFATYFAVVLLLSGIAYLAVERPFMRLRDIDLASLRNRGAKATAGTAPQ